jgi:hypothetical protein
MMTRKLVSIVILASALALAAAAQEPPPAQPAPSQPAAPQLPPVRQGPDRFEGTIVNQGGPLARFFQAGYFTVSLDRYSTNDELKGLLSALQAGGQKLLLEKLWKLDQIGYLKVGGSMGFPLVVARSLDIPGGGRVVRVLTNRGIAPAEFYTMSRSTQYPFGFIEIFLPEGEKGYGTLIPTAQVELTRSGQITVESLGTMPVRLMDVEVKVKAKKEK